MQILPLVRVRLVLFYIHLFAFFLLFQIIIEYFIFFIQ